MKKSKLPAVALTALIALGCTTSSAFAASVPDVSLNCAVPGVAMSESSVSSVTMSAVPVMEGQEYAQFSNEDYVKSLTGITDEEKALLIETYNALDKLYEQVDGICGDKEVLSESEEKQVDGLSDQIDALYEKIAGIEDKVYGGDYWADDAGNMPQISNEEYVKGLAGITEEEKTVLLETYNSMDKLYTQLDELYAGADELNAVNEKKAEALYDEIDKLQSRISPIEDKIFCDATEAGLN